MKKLFVMLFLMISSLGIAYAQADLTALGKTPEERAEKHTQKLVKGLNLNADQAAKVKAVNLDNAKKVDQIRAKYPSKGQGSRKGMGQELKTLNDNLEAQYKTIFSADQYSKYLQAKEAKKEKLKEHRERKMQDQ